MKKCKLCKMTALFCAAFLTVCAFLWNMQSVQGDGDTALYYWGFENTTADAAGTLTSGSEGSFTAGRQGQALNVAENGAVKSGAIPTDTTMGFTMAAWIYLNEGAEGYNIIMSSGNTAAEGSERFQLHIGQAGPELGGGYLLAFAPAVDPLAFPGDGDEQLESCLVPYETWTHAAVTFNGEKAVLYMNGTPVLERTAAAGLGTLALHKQITIGALNHDAVTFQFNGAIDEAVYANYPMKAAEIAALASDPAAAAGDLDGWAKGTKTIEPDAIVTPPENTSEPSELPTGGTTIYYWPFDESSEDLSHYEMYFDEYDIGLEYTDGAVNQGVDTSFGGALSVPFEEEQDFSCFTISFWMRWDGSAPGYGVLFAAAGKEQPYHTELYTTTSDGEHAQLAFFNTGMGNPMEGLAPIEIGELYHVACTYDGAMLRIYVNGELAMETSANVDTAGFGSNFDALALGCLTDSTLPFMGMLDEVILADYAFDEALIAKLYSSPEEGAAEIAGLVKANYPEDYAPATEAPEATAAPATATKAPVTAAATVARTPVKTAKPAETDHSTTIAVIIIVVTVAVIAAAVAIVLVMKKKAAKK